MLSAKWFVIWICRLVIFTGHRLKNSLPVVIYSIITYFVLFTIDNSIVELYADTTLYTLLAAILASYYLIMDKQTKEIVVFSGLLVLPYFKTYFVLALALYLLVIFIF